MQQVTLELHAVPQAGKAHELAVLAPREVRLLVLGVFVAEPLVEALGDHDAPLLPLYRGPHPAVLEEGVVATVDRLSLGAIVRAALAPKGDETCGAGQRGGRYVHGARGQPHCIDCSWYVVAAVASCWPPPTTPESRARYTRP